MKKKYTHLFFDLDNTLWDFEKNSYTALRNVFESYRTEMVNLNFDVFFEKYSINNKMLWSKYRNKEISKKELTVKRFQDTFNDFKIKGIKPELMNALYLAEMPNQNELINGVHEMLQYLKKRRYKMFIITNGFKEVQNKKLVNSAIDKYFRKIFISEDVKSPKPSKEIFEHAIKSANAPKISSLMIGDDWDSDIEGALSFGIDAVFYNPNSVDYQNKLLKLEKKHLNVYSIAKLNDLEVLL